MSCYRWAGAYTPRWSAARPRPWPSGWRTSSDERFSFIDTCQRVREELPRPDLPLVVGLDGGYVHSAAQRSRRDGWFEVIAGKAVPAQGRPSCFGYVPTYDTKPKRRLYEVLTSHGVAANQQVTFLTDGGEDIRELPCYLNPQAEHLLDWFHITMRITVMTNMAKSLQPPPPDPDLELSVATATKLIGEIRGDLPRLKWFLWHGNVFRALQTVEGIIIDLETLQPGDEPSKLLTAASKFDTYLRANAGRIPNYGERRRAGDAISTAFTESAVNQVISKRMVKKQQMRWTLRGAHLLVQIRARVLNDQLADDFHRRYPNFTRAPDTTVKALAGMPNPRRLSRYTPNWTLHAGSTRCSRPASPKSPALGIQRGASRPRRRLEAQPRSHSRRAAPK